MNQESIAVFWFRRDLRVEDNHGLYRALQSGLRVLPIFIFDTNILNNLEQDDSRLSFILHEQQKLQEQFERLGSSCWVYHGKPLDAFKNLLKEYRVADVYTNQDYEPYARQRDNEIKEYLEAEGAGFKAYKDQVIFHQNEIVKSDGYPYTVYTPYSKKWLAALSDEALKSYPSEDCLTALLPVKPMRRYHHPDLGFKHGPYRVPELKLDEGKLVNYGECRDFPAMQATSRLGVHLRFGTLSIRKLTRLSLKLSPTFLNELIWRNFYMDILWHFPHVAERSFIPE